MMDFYCFFCNLCHCCERAHTGHCRLWVTLYEHVCIACCRWLLMCTCWWTTSPSMFCQLSLIGSVPQQDKHIILLRDKRLTDSSVPLISKRQYDQMFLFQAPLPIYYILETQPCWTSCRLVSGCWNKPNIWAQCTHSPTWEPAERDTVRYILSVSVSKWNMLGDFYFCS